MFYDFYIIVTLNITELTEIIEFTYRNLGYLYKILLYYYHYHFLPWYWGAICVDLTVVIMI